MVASALSGLLGGLLSLFGLLLGLLPSTFRPFPWLSRSL